MLKYFSFDDSPIDNVQPIVFNTVNFQHVLVHARAMYELHFAHGTRIILLFGVLPLMALQLAPGVARQFTFITFKWPFAGMPLEMRVQTLLHISLEIAQIATELPFGLMYPRMIDELDARHKRRSTNFTTIILYIVMPVHMSF